MNVVSVTRALRATNKKVSLLQERRKSAKDKPLWDGKNGDALATFVRYQTKLTKQLLAALAEQGKFDDTDREVPVHVDDDYDAR